MPTQAITAVNLGGLTARSASPRGDEIGLLAKDMILRLLVVETY